MRLFQRLDLGSESRNSVVTLEMRAERYRLTAPSGVSLAAGEELVTVRWEPDANPFIEAYTIRRHRGSATTWDQANAVSYELLQDPGAPPSEFADTDVAPEQTYTHQLAMIHLPQIAQCGG
jgi:hypothetical protein